jgi:hypothetical protein
MSRTGVRFFVYTPLYIETLNSSEEQTAFFNMVLRGFRANNDRPLYRFCIDSLLGSKYAGWRLEIASRSSYITLA